MDGGLQFLTVSQINGYIKRMFDMDDVLSGISVCGEISNIKYHSSGHLYLTLKDEGAAISAVMFRSDLMRMDFRPENGMRVIASGRISVYERGGQYQLYISHMRPDGLGQLYMALEALKKRLGAEGLFDPSRKKKLPPYPRRIGVVTSSTGAVIRDIIKVTSRRYPLCEIVLFPVHVQGEFAVGEICAGIEYFNIENNVDVMIVGRGGGSVEDLWAFNSEAVVRAVALSSIPVISAVGHQSDVTLCDLVADVTAGTPSMAAELAVPDMLAIREKLDAAYMRISKRILSRLDDKRIYLDERTSRFELNSPKNKLERSVASLETKSEKLNALMAGTLSDAKLRLAKGASKLDALSPLSVIARGYGFVQDEKGKTLTSVLQIEAGDDIKITMSDGYAKAHVTDVKKDQEKENG